MQTASGTAVAPAAAGAGLDDAVKAVEVRNAYTRTTLYAMVRDRLAAAAGLPRGRRRLPLLPG